VFGKLQSDKLQSDKLRFVDPGWNTYRSGATNYSLSDRAGVHFG
jgi:hypothetical protein